MGEIPKHWKAIKLKHLAQVRTGYTPPKINDNNYCKNGVVWVKPDNLNEFIPIVDSKEKISEEGLRNNSIIPKGSVLVCCIGSIGKFGVAGIDLITNQQINSLIFNDKINIEYGKFLVAASESEHDRNSNGNVVKILNGENQKNIFLVCPPLVEQIRIASFLDHKTTQIDTLIEKKEHLVEKLTLKRQAIINEAVTKGLNPDVPMKDSGIEWLGEIPEHWEVVSLKYLVNHSTTKGNGKSKLKVALENIESQTGVYLESEKKEFEGELKEFKKDDILFNKLRPYLAKVFKAPEDGECVSELLVFTCLSPVLIPDFLFWKLISQQIISVVDSSTYGAKMPRVGTDFMLNLPIALPLKDEQEGIIKHIADKIKIIDATSEKAKESIEKLKLYRQSLISEAVTGKIDLRDWKQTDNK